MDKRQIIREKSVYSRKKNRWTMLDEIQFKWIWFRLRKKKVWYCRNVRPKVEVLLVKHEKQVVELEENWYKIYPM